MWCAVRDPNYYQNFPKQIVDPAVLGYSMASQSFNCNIGRRKGMVMSAQVPMSEFVIQAVRAAARATSLRTVSTGTGIPVNLSGRSPKKSKKWCILVHLMHDVVSVRWEP